MSELSELLNKHLPKGWSGRRLGREAQARGFDLSEASATAYLGGRHGTPDDSTIEAFVGTLKIPERLVRKAAKVRMAGEPWNPPADSRYLRDDQRAALDQLISTMVEREVGTGDVAPAAKKTDELNRRRRGRSAPPAPEPDDDDSFAGPDPASYPEPLAADEPGEPSEGELRRDEQDEAEGGSQEDGGTDPV